MGFTEVEGDLFDAVDDFDAIAHGCNCEGHMGAGFAKQIKQRYPKCFAEYEERCKQGNNKATFSPGYVYVYRQPNTPVIFNLGIQVHRLDAAPLHLVDTCISKMFDIIDVNYDIKEIAMPRIGNNPGGLDWRSVSKLIQGRLSLHPDINVTVFSS